MKSEIQLISKRIECFSQVDAIGMINKDVLKEIKAKDEHPYFQAYSIAHEGYSMPSVNGKGGKLIKWSRAAIQSISKAIKKGVKFFYRHTKDLSTEGREVFGEAVAFGEKIIDGILNMVVVGYFPPDKRELVKNMDICSQEGYWDFYQRGQNELEADKCEEITGIALSRSDIEAPAFAGAKQLAMVQCMSDATVMKPVDQIINNNGVKTMEVTFNDVVKFVNDHQVWPSQLYGFDKIQQDHKYSKYFEDFRDEKKTLSQELETLKTTNQTLTETLQASESEKLKLTINSRFDKYLKDNDIKMTDLEKKFIVKRLDTITDPTDEGLKTFIESKQSDYRVMQELNNSNSVPEESQSQGDGSSIESGNTEVTDYTDPTQNDLI